MSDHKRQRSTLVFDNDLDAEVLKFISGCRTHRLRNKYLLWAIDHGIPGPEPTLDEYVWNPRTVPNRTEIRISVTREFPNTYLKWLHLPTFMRLQAFRAYAKRGVPRIMGREAPPVPPSTDLSVPRPLVRHRVRDYEELPPEMDLPIFPENTAEALNQPQAEAKDNSALDSTQRLLLNVIGDQLNSEVDTDSES